MSESTCGTSDGNHRDDPDKEKVLQMDAGGLHWWLFQQRDPHARHASVEDLGSMAIAEAQKQQRGSTLQCKHDRDKYHCKREQGWGQKQMTFDGSGSMGKNNSSQMVELGLMKNNSEILRDLLLDTLI